MKQETKYMARNLLGLVMGVGLPFGAIYTINKIEYRGSRRVISALDTNHDGVLSAEEKAPFVQWLLASGGVSLRFYDIDIGQTTLPESIRSELEKTLIDKKFDFQRDPGVSFVGDNTVRINTALGEEYVEQHPPYKTSK